MILYYYGNDTFRSSQEVIELKDRYLKQAKNHINLITLDMEVADFDDLLKELKSLPLFSETRLLIVRDAVQCIPSSQHEQLIASLQDEEKNKDLVIVFHERGKRKSHTLAKYLSKQKLSKEFDTLKGMELSMWAKQWVESHNYRIDPQALEMLVLRSAGDLWWLSNELELLSNFRGEETITVEDVQSMTKLKVDPDIFKTIDAIAARDGALALRLLHHHLEHGESEMYLLSMVNYQFTNLLQVKELVTQGMNQQDIKKVTKMHPFVIEKSLRQSANFSLPQLKSIFSKLADVDAKVKTGKIEARLALDLLVSGLTV